uniref:hypothetical protein n=1 Tax=Crenothrix polyspora TaxID=360316 RepID=UPI000B35AEDE|nr:hypothetical protein [Crenothrix polyspora]
MPHSESNSENLFLTGFGHTPIEAISQISKCGTVPHFDTNTDNPLSAPLIKNAIAIYRAVKTTSVQSAALCRTLNSNSTNLFSVALAKATYKPMAKIHTSQSAALCRTLIPKCRTVPHFGSDTENPLSAPLA